MVPPGDLPLPCPPKSLEGWLRHVEIQIPTTPAAISRYWGLVTVWETGWARSPTLWIDRSPGQIPSCREIEDREGT